MLDAERISQESLNLKLIFAGTPDFAAQHLKILIDAGHELLAGYTQPDRPAGRGKKPQASPVKKLALKHGLPVEQPLNFRSDEALQTLAGYGADLMVVVGTSSVVYPAAGLPELAVANGTPVIEVNPEPTPLSDSATVTLREKAASALPGLLQRLPVLLG